MNFKNFCFLAFFDQTNSLALATKKVTEAERHRGKEAQRQRSNRGKEAQRQRSSEAKKHNYSSTIAAAQRHRGKEAQRQRGTEPWRLKRNNYVKTKDKRKQLQRLVVK